MKQSDDALAGGGTKGEIALSANSYDEVAYPGGVFADTIPERLAVVGILAGMNPAPPARSRVLELGCGDGTNVIAMAYGLPESEFVGIDLAAQPIARGQEMVSRIGLKNLSLRQMGVEEVDEDLGQFDYIVGHGLFSWVPGEVREKIMAVCAARLTANGVAFLSYNAYPGSHLRDLVRGMMRYHSSRYATPAEQVGQARGLVRFLAENAKEGRLYRQVLVAQMERIATYLDSALFHDDLNVTNQPLYFHEFMGIAERHGLQYLGEAELPAMREPDCPAEAQAILQQLGPEDFIRGEQYRDFLRGREFRQTLLCRKDVAIKRDLQPEYVESLFVAGELQAVAETPESPAHFTGRKAVKLETERPLVNAALRRLAATWPAFVSFRELLMLARSEAGRVGDASEANDRQELTTVILQAAIAGVLELRAHPPQLVAEPGEKPKASTLARLQLQTEERVSSLLHGTVQMENQLARVLLGLLDGTRDRQSLRAAMERAARAAGDSETVPERVSESAIEQGLIKLARLGLLVQ